MSEQTVARQMEDLNLPRLFANRSAVKKYALETPTAFLALPKDGDIPDALCVANDIYVGKTLYALGFDAKYFATKITGKSVYAPLFLFGGYLPVQTKAKYVVTKDAASQLPDDYDYRQVIFTDEQTLGDLYKNAWRYRYSPDTDTFMRLPDEGALINACRMSLAKEIAVIGGDAMDRIADYGRLILFLLAKALPNMTQEEQEVFKELSTYMPVVKDLHDIINRETHIQAAVHDFKENPLGVTEDE